MQITEKVILFGFKTGEDYPPVDIYETEKAYFFIFDIAGVKIEDILLKICDENLMLVGRRKKGPSDKPVIWHCRELPSEDFQRRLPLPEDIDPEGAEARYSEGVLKVKIPKKRKKVYKIDIKGE